MVPNLRSFQIYDFQFSPPFPFSPTFPSTPTPPAVTPPSILGHTPSLPSNIFPFCLCPTLPEPLSECFFPKIHFPSFPHVSSSQNPFYRKLSSCDPVFFVYISFWKLKIPPFDRENSALQLSLSACPAASSILREILISFFSPDGLTHVLAI